MIATLRSLSCWVSRLAAAGFLLSIFTLPILPVAWASPRAGAPPGLLQVDISQRIDVNQISMVVTNTGSIGFDKTFGGPGLEFPRGSGKAALFAAGLWVGGFVGPDLRMAISEYSDEYGPGPVLGGLPADPLDPLHRVYKLQRSYASTFTRDSALAAYEAGAEPYGAPNVDVQPDGTLNIQGDQMLWCVYNDLDPLQHTNRAGNTAPVGIEVRQTVFAFDRPGPPGNTVFVEYQIVNVAPWWIDLPLFALWGDPDLGDFTDDLVGCDTLRNLGYCYNADNDDTIYGTSPPAIGFDLLGVRSTAWGALFPPMLAFNKYVNGTDPTNAFQSYNYLWGVSADGTPIISPVTNEVTKYVHSGDPVAGTGWRDANPGDRRMTPSGYGIQLAPGETLRVDAAIIVSQGTDRLDSVARLYLDDDVIQSIYDGNPPPPPPPPCAVQVEFELKPGTINLRSMGRWVSGHLEVPAPYTPEDVDVASILLGGTVPVDPGAPVSIGDGNGNGAPELHVKFDRQAVQAAFAPGDSVPIPVSGRIGEECFAGGDVTRLIQVPVTAPDTGSVVTPGLASPIRWETPPDFQPLWVAVLASLDGGENWTLVAKHLPNTGIYYWHPPYAAVPSARVAVVLVEEEGSEDVVEGVLGIGGRFTIGAPTGIGPGEPSFAIRPTAPHPARGSLRLTISLPGGNPAVLSVHDLAGRRVWSRDMGALGAGTHTVTAGEGASLPAGVYLVRLQRDGQERTARAVLVR